MHEPNDDNSSEKKASVTGVFSDTNAHKDPELASYIKELQKANETIRASRRSALNALEDAILSKEALRESEEKFRFKLEKDVRDRTAELNASKDLLEASIDSSLDIIQVFQTLRNESGKIVDFTWLIQNKKATEQNGDVIGKSLLSQNPGIVTAGIFKRMVQVIETGIPQECELYYNHEAIDAWFYQALVSAGDDVLVMTTRDITEREKAEQEILRLKDEIAQKATDRYYSLFNSIDEGFCIVELVYDENGKIKDLIFREQNPSFDAHTGLGNVVGKSARELLPHYEQHWIEMYEKISATGESLRVENYSKDLDRWYNVYFSRVGGTNSKYVAVIFDDITKRKRQELYKAFLSSITEDLVVFTNITETIESLCEKLANHFGVKWSVFAEMNNDAESYSVYGWNADDVLSLKGTHRISDYLSVEQILRNNAGELTIVNDTQTDPQINAANSVALGVRSLIIVPLVRNGQWSFQLLIIDNKPRQWREDEIELLKEVTSRIWMRLESARAEEMLRKSEETYRNELEQQVFHRTEELQRSNQDLLQFAHVTSHDLKEPVRKIRTFTGMLVREFEAGMPEKAQTYLHKIKLAIERVASMIEAILNYSRVGITEEAITVVDLNRIFEAIEADLELLIMEKNALIVRPVLPMVKGSEILLHQLFYNLMTNSLKFAREEEPLRVTITSRLITKEHGAFIELSLQDNGIGFETEYNESIFEAFSRLNPKDSYEGTGLGLALCKKIVNRHHGYIYAKGDLGKGSLFTVQLPADL